MSEEEAEKLAASEEAERIRQANNFKRDEKGRVITSGGKPPMLKPLVFQLVVDAASVAPMSTRHLAALAGVTDGGFRLWMKVGEHYLRDNKAPSEAEVKAWLYDGKDLKYVKRCAALYIKLKLCTAQKVKSLVKAAISAAEGDELNRPDGRLALQLLERLDPEKYAPPAKERTDANAPQFINVPAKIFMPVEVPLQDSKPSGDSKAV